MLRTILNRNMSGSICCGLRPLEIILAKRSDISDQTAWMSPTSTLVGEQGEEQRVSSGLLAMAPCGTRDRDGRKRVLPKVRVGLESLCDSLEARVGVSAALSEVDQGMGQIGSRHCAVGSERWNGMQPSE